MNQPIDLLSISIQGERIVLKPISEQFADEIFKEFTKEITRFMYPKSSEKKEETVNFIKRSIQQMITHTNLILYIIKKENNEFLGCCGLHCRGKANTPEIGIWIKKSEHGKNYG